MFTGLVRESALVKDFQSVGNNLWKIECLTRISEAKSWPIGASIALNGVCLTLVTSEAETSDTQRVAFEVTSETMSCTSLGDLKAGCRIHLEPSLKVGDSLGGHWVLGHVDGVGKVSAREFQGDCLFLEIQLQGKDRARIAPYLVDKGSVAVDGVSLTINSLSDSSTDTRFTLLLIPHTLTVTRFKDLQLGERVNLEADILAKFSARERQFQKGIS
jgi:riboflavin synthase